MSDGVSRTQAALVSVMLAAPVAFFVGLVVFWQTARIDCANHTVDACIPTVELLLGGVLGVFAAGWLARKFYSGLGRPDAQRPWEWSTETAAAAVALVVGLVGWVVAMRLAGPRVCPAREADYVCSGGLVLGVAAFFAAAICVEILQRVILRRRAPSG